VFEYVEIKEGSNSRMKDSAEELNNLYYSLHIIKLIDSRGM
jgi:hypothetical protein